MLQQGEARGINLGREEGITLGARQTSIESTLNVFTHRFPSADINALKRQLEAIDDLNRLKQLNLFVYTAKSLHDFQQSLNGDHSTPETEFFPSKPSFFLKTRFLGLHKPLVTAFPLSV